MVEFNSYAPGTPSWVDVVWGDHDAAADFYGAVFGWTRSELPAEAGGYEMFELNGKPIAGLAPKMDPSQPTFWTSYIAVADADATAAKITDAGGSLLFGPMQVLDSGKMAVFAAPDGSMAAVWQAETHMGSAFANEPGAFTWNELNTRDEAAASAFYSSVFGWEPETNDMGGHPYTMWNVSGGPVAGMTPMPPMVPIDVPSYWLVYFGVASTDAAVEIATDKGAQLLVAPVDSPAGRFAIVADPEGAPFAVIQIGASA